VDGFCKKLGFGLGFG